MKHKYDRAYITINLNNIIDNVNAVNDKLGGKAKILAVIKADGYGHGAVPIAKELEQIDCVKGFATATMEEALFLRNAGIKKTILVLGYLFSDQYEDAINNDISVTVYSYECAEKLSETAISLGKKANVHIKVDTGMNRIGIHPSVMTIAEVQEIAELDGLFMEGIFTHFPNADLEDKEDTYKRLKDYKDFVKLLKIGGVDFQIHHYANSACIIDLPCDDCDVVRLGVSLYGLYPSDEVLKNNVVLKPALKLYAAIIHIKDIEKGDSVSYGSTFTAEKPMRVATVSLGYGDGYPRSLSNKGYVLVNGHRAPILGRICMDQFMIDITGIDDVKVEDMVVIIGKSKDEVITVDELGDLSGRFSYEFVCDLGKRIPRIYIKDKNIVHRQENFMF